MTFMQARRAAFLQLAFSPFGQFISMTSMASRTEDTLRNCPFSTRFTDRSKTLSPCFMVMGNRRQMSASHETSYVFKGSHSAALLLKVAHGGAGRSGCANRSLRMRWVTMTSEVVNVLANFQGNPIDQQPQHVRLHRYVSNHPPHCGDHVVHI